MKKYTSKDLPKLKKKLWVEFAKYIKLRDKNICFTCGAVVDGQNSQAGHFIPKSVGGLILYFNEENVHCQCGKCNLFLQGNQYVYGEKLGKETVTRLRSMMYKIEKWSVQDYLNKIEEYKNKCKKLTS